MNPIYQEKGRFWIYTEYLEVPGFFKPKQISYKDIIKTESNNFFGTITVFTADKKYSFKTTFKHFIPLLLSFIQQDINENDFLKQIKQAQIDNNPILKEAQEYFDTVTENKAVPTITTDLFLKDKEEAILEEENCSISETRAVRSHSGKGGSVRIAKGVSIGGYSGTSRSNQEWKVLDFGTLTLTNKRIIYTGNKETRDILLSKVVSAKIEKGLWGSSRYLEINTSNRKKSIRFSIQGNEYIWSLLLQLLKQGADLLHIEEELDLTIEA